jgi:adenine-specific DNA-methyltransferase
VITTEEDETGKFRCIELRNTHREFGKHNRKDMFFPLYVNSFGEVSISADGGVQVLPIWDDGFEGCWTWGKTKAIDEVDLLIGRQVNNRWKIYRKSYANGAERMLKTILTDKAFTTERGQKELNQLFKSKGKLFQSPKSPFFISILHKTCTAQNDLILDFFAGSGTTAEAVMRLNAEDGGQRQFILVQIPQPIDPAKQKEAHDFVTKTLKRPEATIFEITAERIRRAGAQLQNEQAAKRKAQGELLADDTTPLDTGFRVFELVDDPLGLVHSQTLKDARQDQVQQLQQRMGSPQPNDMERVLSNLLLAEGLPLTTCIHTLVPETLFVAEDVALLLQALPLEELQQHLHSLQADRALHYLTVYAPWLKDDNLLLGLDTLMEQLGLGKDKLRLRG